MTGWVAPDVEYTINDNGTVTVVTPKARIAKVSGTMMGALLGQNPWKSQFVASANLLNLGIEDISDKPAIKTGSILESVIINYARAHLSDVQIFAADDLFPARSGAHRDWLPDFEDPDFTGHIDGIINIDGTDYILEVKTTSSWASWKGTVPSQYYWQVALYNHFITQQDRAYFLVAEVNDAVHANPFSFVPSWRNVHLLQVNIDCNQVAREIETVRGIRHSIIDTQTTFAYNPAVENDNRVMQFLQDFQSGGDEIETLVAEYDRLANKIQVHDASIDDIRKRAEDLKDRIKGIMDHNQIAKVGKYTLGTHHRTSYDVDKMVEDGIDPAKYQKETIYRVLRATKR